MTHWQFADAQKRKARIAVLHCVLGNRLHRRCRIGRIKLKAK